MNSDTPTPPPPQDDIGQSADQLSQNLENATNGVDDIANNLEQIVEKGISQAEDKLDGFLKSLDNFLGKF